MKTLLKILMFIVMLYLGAFYCFGIWKKFVIGKTFALHSGRKYKVETFIIMVVIAMIIFINIVAWYLTLNFVL